MRTKIEEFREHMPLIHTLCNPGLRDRHWEQVSEIVGYTLEPGTDLTLAKLIDLSLEEYIAKFEAISDSASKEHNLEKAMGGMIAEWTDQKFDLVPYRYCVLRIVRELSFSREERSLIFLIELSYIQNSSVDRLGTVDCQYGLLCTFSSGTHILSGIDDVQVLLDDHIVKTQTMRGSPFVKPFEKDVK
jgi:dynein heavy chain